MRTGKYRGFILQNAAPYNTTGIGIYNGEGKRLGGFGLQHLKLPILGEKLYSFGALSDIHIGYDGYVPEDEDTAIPDFQKALQYLNEEEDVAFTCICGDMTDNGYESELLQYKKIVDQYSADTPVYAIAGNHETYDLQSYSYLERYTGHPLYYTFERGNDVFIMCGCYGWHGGNKVFTNESLQWLYEMLEANRNKRCFVFQHVLPFGDSGNPLGAYKNDLLGIHTEVFVSLLRHYKNTILFHGHTHTKFDLQRLDKKANYSEAFGYRSVHIPSISAPRDIVDNALKGIYAESEGYVVDVYQNHVVLKGRDFIKEEYLPIAMYCLNTRLEIVEANSYADMTGIINASGEVKGND